MAEGRIITQKELARYGKADDLNAQAAALVKQQVDTWELAGKNYAALPEVQTRCFSFGHFQIDVHHNPGRIRSSAAKTDAHSIAQRPCFLCAGNLPPEQKGIVFGNHYLILTNPFPIFPVHLTISHLKHIPQRLEHFFDDMLELSRQLRDFTVFYNGPQCGASAPDHFHFQAGSRGMLPVEKELSTLKDSYAREYYKTRKLEIIAVENYLRRFVAFISSQKNELSRVFQFLYASLQNNGQTEPMMNVLSFYRDDKWHVILFPRERQRPCHFFKEGKDQIVIGPAAVEMGGSIILPRHEDYLKADKAILAEIYDEVTISGEAFEFMLNILKSWHKSQHNV